MGAKRRRLVILDALRAIAGLAIPLFHICEPLTHPPEFVGNARVSLRPAKGFVPDRNSFTLDRQ